MRSCFIFLMKVLFLSTYIFVVACSEETTDEKKKTGFSIEVDQNGDISPKVIYGTDNRRDLFEINDPRILNIADATVALVYKGDLVANGAMTTLSTSPFADTFRLPLCADERFREQETVAFCSGFLIAPNIIATAGHCVQTQGSPTSDCETTKFVFGFHIEQSGFLPNAVPTDEVYSCKRILKYKQDGNGADFSIIELDRAVPNHMPINYRKSGAPSIGEDLTVLGHPSGLPLKIADEGIIRSLHNGFLRASLDTYGGNSGSAVINSRTLEVEGILVRGETDYVVKSGNCMSSKVCDQNGCRGEDVTTITELVPFLPE